MRQKRARDRNLTGQRVTCVIRHPLAEIGIGVFVAVMIGSRQFVMDLQRGGERSYRKQECHQQQGDDRTESGGSVTAQHDDLIVQRIRSQTPAL